MVNQYWVEHDKRRKESIEVVSGDGARWITEYNNTVPSKTDPFHIVEWANEALDEIRKESWRDANNGSRN